VIAKPRSERRAASGSLRLASTAANPHIPLRPGTRFWQSPTGNGRRGRKKSGRKRTWRLPRLLVTVRRSRGLVLRCRDIAAQGVVHHVRLEAIDCLAANYDGRQWFSTSPRNPCRVNRGRDAYYCARAPQTERALCNTVIHVGLIKADGDACTRKPYRPEDVI
jgi:hypothetical protein